MIITYSRENWFLVILPSFRSLQFNKLKNSKNGFTKPDMSM